MPEEVRTTNETTGGQKGVKLERFDLIPVRPLVAVARLYGFGAQKYESRNWERGYEWSKSYGALQRHANAFWGGEDLIPQNETGDDPTAGMPHMAAVAWHAFALMEWPLTHPELDDRPTAKVIRQDRTLFGCLLTDEQWAEVDAMPNLAFKFQWAREKGLF